MGLLFLICFISNGGRGLHIIGAKVESKARQARIDDAPREQGVKVFWEDG